MSFLEHPANRCFVCGPNNPIGLHMTFSLEDGRCVSEYTLGDEWIGWRDQVHGGILYAMLDDVMANWMYLHDEIVFTARCEVRYRQPLEVRVPIRLEGWPLARRRGYVKMRGMVTRLDTRVLVAEAEAGFIIRRPSQRP